MKNSEKLHISIRRHQRVHRSSAVKVARALLNGATPWGDIAPYGPGDDLAGEEIATIHARSRDMMADLARAALRVLPTQVDHRDIAWHVAVIVDGDDEEVIDASDLGPSVTSAIIDDDADDA